MAYVATLKKQHEEIKGYIDWLRNNISLTSLEEKAQEISQKISYLAGVIKVHLGAEDEYLYPQLIKSGNDDLKKLAEDYVSEMGYISSAFIDYKSRFNTKPKILNSTSEFINETHKILNVLEGRIKKEELSLYPIL